MNLNEVDRTIPINTSGPNLGISFYTENSKDTEFMFIKGKSRMNVPLPVAVKINKQGGEYSMLEFFYHPGQGPRAMDIYDGKTFLLVRKEVVKDGRKNTAKKIGSAYGKLACTGKLRDVLPDYPNVRFDKYVCQTEGLNDWNDITNHLDGLGAPKEMA